MRFRTFFSFRVSINCLIDVLASGSQFSLMSVSPPPHTLNASNRFNLSLPTAGWVYDTSVAMVHMALARLFRRHPDLKARTYSYSRVMMIPCHGMFC